MSVNVRWNGRGWPGKVPRSPVASPIGKGTRKMNWKNGRPKGTVKAVWQKTGMAILKKKKKKKDANCNCIFTEVAVDLHLNHACNWQFFLLCFVLTFILFLSCILPKKVSRVF
jgi:hypothetical protein